ncbi:anti-repressor SinI family protein [Bacillus sp. J37]|nr:anti-repressor SinI family protein [Bacillus sp. J37]HWK21547.1 anti-repressor SinI family protein [Ureibacillus sp.]
MTEISKNYIDNQIDREWLELIQEAKKIGLSYDQIQAFLQQGGTSEK